MNADFYYSNESSIYHHSYDSDFDAPCYCNRNSQIFDETNQHNIEMFQLTESAPLDGGFLN